jgi:hypothetical protein
VLDVACGTASGRLRRLRSASHPAAGGGTPAREGSIVAVTPAESKSRSSAYSRQPNGQTAARAKDAQSKRRTRADSSIWRTTWKSVARCCPQVLNPVRSPGSVKRPGIQDPKVICARLCFGSRATALPRSIRAVWSPNWAGSDLATGGSSAGPRAGSARSLRRPSRGGS